MPAHTVTSTPAALDLTGMPDLQGTGQTLVIQNLGPGDVYADFDEDVDDSSGVKISSGVVWEIASYVPSRPLYVMSTSTSDVRYLVVS